MNVPSLSRSPRNWKDCPWRSTRLEPTSRKPTAAWPITCASTAASVQTCSRHVEDWSPIIPSRCRPRSRFPLTRSNSALVRQTCCARWGEKLKRASWKRAFPHLPERCTSTCHLLIVILSEARLSRVGRCSLALRMTGEAQDDKWALRVTCGSLGWQMWAQYDRWQLRVTSNNLTLPYAT